jgi:hypothetical protein
MEKVNTLEMRATPETMAAAMLAIARQPATVKGDAEWTAAMLDLFRQFYDQGYKDGSADFPNLLPVLIDLRRYCVLSSGLPEKGKGRTEDQKRALDAADKAIFAATGKVIDHALAKAVAPT